MTTEELINALKHVADDHPCCAIVVQRAVERLESLERENRNMIWCMSYQQWSPLWRLHRKRLPNNGR